MIQQIGYFHLPGSLSEQWIIWKCPKVWDYWFPLCRNVPTFILTWKFAWDSEKHKINLSLMDRTYYWQGPTNLPILVQNSNLGSSFGTLTSGTLIDFWLRSRGLLTVLAENAFGVQTDILMKLPLYNQLLRFSEDELRELVKLRVLCFSTSTWTSYSYSVKIYVRFCSVRGDEPFPVNCHLSSS